jgi:hypothetical protein
MKRLIAAIATVALSLFLIGAYLPDGNQDVITVTPTLDTSAYTANDVLFDRTRVTGACKQADGKCILDSIVVIDDDDQTAANLTFYILDADVTLGTANAAPSISDANNNNVLCVIPLASTLILDVTGSKVGSLHNIGCVVKTTTGTSDVWVAATTAGTPTQTASGYQVRLGFRQ